MKTNQTITAKVNLKTSIRNLKALLCSCLLFSSLATHATIRYVKTSATGTGTGLSWANASGDLQAMITASAINDEVWVKNGTYKPTKEPDGTTNSSRDFCFNLKNGVKVYGGFAGSETAITQRIKGSNETILSGDIGTAGVNSDNTYHVVFSFKDSSNTVLNGFTIANGNANASSSVSYTVEGYFFFIARGNGGAMLNYLSNMLVENCEFTDNKGISYGGAIYNEDNDSTKIKYCTFTNNMASPDGEGGAVANFGVAIYEACTFSNNFAGYGGGAARNADSVNYSNCLFVNNTSPAGGAMMNAVNNKFVTVTNCTFSGNHGTILCGGIWNSQTTGYIDKMKIKNSIFWNNKTGASGSTNDEGADIWYYTQGTVNISYTALQLPFNTTNYANARYPFINSSNNVFANNPNFANSTDIDGVDNLYSTADDGLALNPCTSSLLNVGSNTGVSNTDITGAIRIFNSTVDLGAYENNFNVEINVKGNNNTIVNGDLAPNAGNHTNFQNASNSGTTQRVFTIQNLGTTVLTIDSIIIDNITTGGNFEISGITLPIVIVASGSTTFVVTSTPTTSGVKTAQVHVYNNDCDEANYTFAIQSNSNNASCLNFDGVNDFVDAGITLGNFGTSDFTIETWFKTSDTVNMSLISKRNNCNHSNFWSMRIVNGEVTGEVDQNSSQLNYGNVQSPLTYNDGLWHHTAFVRDGIYLYLYVDGILVNNDSTAATTNLSNSAGFNIGTSPCGYFNGSLDETRIWNRALTSCEIQHNMNCEIPTTSTNLLANYHYNQGLGGVNNSSTSTLSDASGNANTGSLQNFELNGATSNWDDDGAVVSNTSCSAYLYAEINVQGNTVSIPDGSTTPLTSNHTDFGNVAALSSLTRTFTIQNTGNGPLSISSITKSGTGASLFAIGTYPASIADSSSATLNVTFSPVNVGLKTATITINTNDCDEAVYTFKIQGQGTCSNNTGSSSVIACGQYFWNGISRTSSGTYLDTFTNVIGCDSVHTLNLTINPLPNVAITASATSVCTGSSLTLAATGALTYSWSNGVTNGIAFTPPATAFYVVTGTDAIGCSKTSFITVTVTSNAAPTVGSTTSATTVCAGSSVTLNGSGANTYTWSGGVSNNIAFAATTTTNYTVTGTATNGCTNSATRTITVNPLPSIGTSASATAVCAGTSVTLNGTGGSSYSWSGGVNNGVAFVPNATTTYTVTGTGTNGCTNTATITITRNSLPIVGSTASATSVCVGTPVTLNGTGAVTYSWSAGVSNGVAFIPNATATYTVTGTNVNGCTKTATRIITVNPLPNIISTQATPNTLTCMGNSILSVTYNGIVTPTYCLPTVDLVGATGDYISNVNFDNGAINNTSGDSASDYTYYSGMVANVVAGNTYSISVTSGGTIFAQSKGVFIDYNKDGDFTDAGEFVWNAPAALGTTTGSFAIPINARNGLLRMRVVCRYLYSITNLFSCSHDEFGEYEDYLLHVTGGNAEAANITWSPNTWLSSNTSSTTNVTGITTSTTYTVTVTDPSTLCSSTDTVGMIVLPCASTLDLKLFIEGYYTGSSTMQPVLMNQGIGSSSSICDSILVELRDSATLNTIDAVTAILNTDGTATCIFNASLVGDYYIVVKHRNGLQTWSSSLIHFSNAIASGTAFYDFSDASSKAYGSNQIQVESGVWAFYAGDLNADENIDLLDISLLEDDINLFSFGYFATDINGDGNVDLLDVPIVEANVNGFIYSIHP